MSNKCVYVHKDSNDVIRYVGSGTLERAYLTCANSARGKEYANFVEANGKLNVEIVAKELSKKEAEDLERELFDEHSETIFNCRRPSSTKPMNKEMFEPYLYYDETSKSCLRWKVSVNSKIKVNSEAGWFSKLNGYYEIQLKGYAYKVHRIIALLHNLNIDDFVIDHIDRNKSNNKINNLRVVSQKQNMLNRGINLNNTSGVQGVYYDKRGKSWTARWSEEGIPKTKSFQIKNYLSSEDAFKFAVQYRKQMVDLHYSNTGKVPDEQ